MPRSAFSQNILLRGDVNSGMESSLKYADVKPVLKNQDKTNRANCRTLTSLPRLREIYLQFKLNQIYLYVS